MLNNDKRKKKVLSPIKRGNNKTYWMRLGTAYVNKDDSINVYLDASPSNFTLQVRDFDERDFQSNKSEENSSSSADRAELPPPSSENESPTTSLPF